MIKRIEKDKQRFRKIVRGAIKKELRKYMSKGEMIGRKGKDLISIPLPQIDIPKFKYGKNRQGVGQGEGDEGQPVGPGEGPGAGDQPGNHILEVDFSLDELAEILGEELELPKIKPRGKKNVKTEIERYTGIRRVGPESLCHFKRTFRQALKRQISLGAYDAKNPMIIPIRPDKRFRSWKIRELPESTAVIIYIMDVSGSMGDEQKELVRTEAFWLDTWLQSQYNEIESHYIIHDAEAQEVNKETFYHTRQSGGTKISSAYQMALNLIDTQFNPEEWNIYVFQFSDGDNWNTGDTEECIKMLKEEILPQVNLFCYGQVKSAYGSGQYIKDLLEHFKDSEDLITSQINTKEEIYDSIKDFLGKGK